MNTAQREYAGIAGAKGPLAFVEGVTDVGFNERVEIAMPDGRLLHGRVLEVGEDLAVVEVFAGVEGGGASDLG